MVWSVWDREGREAASSPHAYFEHVQNNRSWVMAINRRGKIIVGTPLSYKQHGSIGNHFEVENRLVGIDHGVVVSNHSGSFLPRSSNVGRSVQFDKLLDFDGDYNPT